MCGCPTVKAGKKWGQVHTAECKLGRHLDTSLPERKDRHEARI